MADELKPENDEAEVEAWRYRYEAGADYGYARGWNAAIESLKVLNLTDAAEKLEALHGGQLVPVAD